MIPPAMAAAIQSLADHLFVPWLLILLFGSGLFLTARYGVVQVRRFGDALRTFIAKGEQGAIGVLSPFLADQARSSGSGATGSSRRP